MGIQGEFFEKPEPFEPILEEVSTAVAPLMSAKTTASEAAMPATGIAEAAASPISPVSHAAVREGGKRGMKDLSIPKLYYSISEVSRLTGLEQYVLRYWETEFDELRPQKNRAGNRIYSNKDIKFILKIKELLREKRYTIEGAKHILKEERVAEREKAAHEAAPAPDPDQLPIPAQMSHAEAVTANRASEATASTARTPQPTVTLAELESLKNSLHELRQIFTRK